MMKSKKYQCNVAQDKDSWKAEIIRRVSARRSSVTMTKSGFASEAEAMAWGEQEIDALLKKQNLKEMAKRRAKQF